MVPTRTADRPHGPGSCVAPQLAAERRPTGIEERHQGQGGRERDEVNRGGPEEPPPEEPGTENFFLDDDSVPELSGERPRSRRRCAASPPPAAQHQRPDPDLLDVRVPQLDRDIPAQPDTELDKFLAAYDLMGTVLGLDRSLSLTEAASQAVRERGLEAGGSVASGSWSSNKMPGRRKRKKRRKKLPKGSSSSFLHGFRGGAGDLGIMFEYAEEVNEEVAVFWWGGDCSLHDRDEQVHRGEGDQPARIHPQARTAGVALVQ